MLQAWDVSVVNVLMLTVLMSAWPTVHMCRVAVGLHKRLVLQLLRLLPLLLLLLAVVVLMMTQSSRQQIKTGP